MKLIKKFKKQNGITLTELVITIIVMLIIAGASLAMVFDKEGVLQSSQESRKEHEEYAEKEETNTNSLINELDKVIQKKKKNSYIIKIYFFSKILAITEKIRYNNNRIRNY